MPASAGIRSLASVLFALKQLVSTNEGRERASLKAFFSSKVAPLLESARSGMPAG